MRGRITADGVQRYRNRIGVLIPQPPPFNTEVHVDTIRHFATAYGDDNPLYADPDYARSTRWGVTPAPPMFVSTMGTTDARPSRSTCATPVGGAPRRAVVPVGERLAVVPAGAARRPPQRQLLHRGRRGEAEPVRRRTAAVVYHRKEFLNQRGELAAVYRYYFWFAEREASEKTGKYMGVEPKNLHARGVDEIDAAYANEFRRGGDTLYWEDVSESDEMPTMVKGPLSTVEIIGWHQGAGAGFQVAPLRLGYLNRRRIPTFYPKNDYGYYDVAQRVHWEDKRANKVGAPRSYDYGMMRTSWIIHYCTNWMGDDGFLWKQSDQTRKFNFHGDTQWVRREGRRQAARGRFERRRPRSVVREPARRGVHAGDGVGAAPLPRARPRPTPRPRRRTDADEDGVRRRHAGLRLVGLPSLWLPRGGLRERRLGPPAPPL